MTQEEFEAVLDRIYPTQVNMKKSVMLFTRANYAVLHCFLTKAEGQDVEILRSEMNHIEKHGVFSWARKSEEKFK